MRKGILKKRILEGQFRKGIAEGHFRKGIAEGHFRKGMKGTVHKLEFIRYGCLLLMGAKHPSVESTHL